MGGFRAGTASGVEQRWLQHGDLSLPGAHQQVVYVLQLHHIALGGTRALLSCNGLQGQRGPMVEQSTLL